MSTESKTQNAQNTTSDPDSSHSALYYLLQEVSKLSSPKPENFPDRKWPSTGQEVDALPAKSSKSSSSPYAKKEEFNKCNSLKVLNLINLECERILHQGDEENCTNLGEKSRPNYDKSSRIICDGVSKSDDVHFVESTDTISDFESRFTSEKEVLQEKVWPKTTAKFTLDQNANVTEIKEETNDEKITDCDVEMNTELISSNYDGDVKPKPEPDPGLVKEEEPAPPPPSPPLSPPPKRRRTKTPRKQPNPRRSGDLQDPTFQGVTFRMDTELDEDREESRLLITAKYSKEVQKLVRKRPRTRAFVKSSSSDEESYTTSNLSAEGKVCASCCTVKTPMWRDAEDGTPLCNACGIRYKKYRVRCATCWHIPRKESNATSSCTKCGNFVRFKHT